MTETKCDRCGAPLDPHTPWPTKRRWELTFCATTRSAAKLVKADATRVDLCTGCAKVALMGARGLRLSEAAAELLLSFYGDCDEPGKIRAEDSPREAPKRRGWWRR